MRVLHPVRPHEALLDAGTLVRADGAVEAFQVHALDADRAVVRVESGGPALWHLVVGGDGRPERLQVRLRDGGRTLDATLTFFDDEVLVWRRGAEPASEAIAVPPGTRLLWPPVAGRERCLRGLGGASPEAVMFLLVRLRPPDRGWLTTRLAKLTAAATADGVALASPGLPDMALSVDDDGRLAGWVEGGAAVRRTPAAAPAG